MRWVLLLLIVFAVLWYIRGAEDVTPPDIEDSFIGGPVKALHKAEDFEKSHQEANDKRKKNLEEQLEKDAG